jgi:hypothetical protein
LHLPQQSTPFGFPTKSEFALVIWNTWRQAMELVTYQSLLRDSVAYKHLSKYFQPESTL